MDKLKILHFDDEESQKDRIQIWLENLNRYNQSNGIEFKVDILYYSENFCTCPDEFIQKIKNEEGVDLIILDIYDKNKSNNRDSSDPKGSPEGLGILNYLQAKNEELEKPIHVVIASKNYLPHQVDNLRRKYPFVNREFISKSEDHETINIIIENDFMYQDRTLLYEFDVLDGWLQSSIKALGEDTLTKVLSYIRNRKSFKGIFHLSRLASGFSGASLFKLRMGDESKEYVLKVSSDIEKLKDEYDKSSGHYRLLDASLSLRFDIGFEIDGVFAFLVELAEGFTLFDYIKSNSFDTVAGKLHKLYYTQRYKEFYTNKDIDKNYRNIFSSLDEIWLSKIKNNIQNMSSLLDWAITKDKSLSFDKDYIIAMLSDDDVNEKWNDSNLKKAIKLPPKPLVLSHGDFHAKNIIIANSENAFIIDTGDMGYHYWCMDISRLIVYLFLYGVDNGDYEFYSHEQIFENYKIAKSIIDLDSDSLNNLDSKSGYIDTIIWLIDNAEQIHGNLYCKWEFKLGLMKEFIQYSCWEISCSPSKKVLALFASNYALERAEEEVKEEIKLI